MDKNIFLRIDDELKQQTYKSIKLGVKLGKLHEKDNLSSVVRMLLRRFNRIAAKWEK